jgi:hypothetical protein
MAETIVLSGDTAYTAGCRHTARSEIGRLYDCCARALYLLDQGEDVTALFELMDAQQRIDQALELVRSL